MTLSSITRGNGPKQVLFVHGNSQSISYWNETMSSLGSFPGHTSIAVDLPGHGNSARSTNPDVDYTIRKIADDLKNYINASVKGEYVIVANSLGANFVGEIINQLENCKGVMLIGSCAVGKGLEVADVLKPNPDLAGAFAAEPAEDAIDALIDTATYKATRDKKSHAKSVYKKTDPLFRSSLAACVANRQYGDELANLERSGVPIAFVYGAEETICFTDALDKIRFPMWKQKAILIPDAGHICQLDKPVELAAVIYEFTTYCFDR